MTKRTYTPSLHAVERARHRFGIDPSQAERWFNDTLRKANYLFSQTNKGRSQLVYEFENMRLIVDDVTRTIVTITPTVDTSILKPLFDREFRKLKREVTRNCREIELNIAELTIKLGERMTAKARARNPQVRELIQRNISELMTKIDDSQAEMTREQDRLENFVKATGVFG